METEREWAPIGTVVRDLAVRFTVADGGEAVARPAGCPACEGAGYYKEAVPYGHPHSGVLFPCGCTLVAEQRRRLADLANLSNLAAFHDWILDKLNRARHQVSHRRHLSN